MNTNRANKKILPRPTYQSKRTSTQQPFVYFQGQFKMQQQQILPNKISSNAKQSNKINSSVSGNLTNKLELQPQSLQQNYNVTLYKLQDVMGQKIIQYEKEIFEEIRHHKFSQQALNQMGYKVKNKKKRPLQRIMYPSYQSWHSIHPLNVENVKKQQKQQNKQVDKSDKYFSMLGQFYPNQVIYLKKLFIQSSNDVKMEILRRFTILPKFYYKQFKHQISKQNYSQNYLLLDLSNLSDEIFNYSIHVTELFELKWINLVVLDFQNSNIGDSTWKQISFNIGKFPQIRKIFLTKNRIQHIRRADFNSFLELKYLQMLNLQQNPSLTQESQQVIRKLSHYNQYIGKFKLVDTPLKQQRVENKTVDFIEQHQLMEPEQVQFLQIAFPFELLQLTYKCEQAYEIVNEKMQNFRKDLFNSSSEKIFNFVIEKGISLLVFINKYYSKFQSQPFDQIVVDFLKEFTQQLCDSKISLTSVKQSLYSLYLIAKQQTKIPDRFTKFQKISKIFKYLISRLLLIYFKKKYPFVTYELVESMKYTKKILLILFDIFIPNIILIWGTSSNDQQVKKSIHQQRLKALQRILSYRDQDQEKYQQIQSNQLKHLDNSTRKNIWKLYSTDLTLEQILQLPDNQEN